MQKGQSYYLHIDFLKNLLSYVKRFINKFTFLVKKILKCYKINMGEYCR